jgi:LuxR family transcriptional regulator, maltose regulon positive regulatory protein
VMSSLALESRSAGALALVRGFQAELALRQGRLAEAGEWAEQYSGPVATPQPFFYRRPLTLVRILLAQDTQASRQRAGELLTTLSAYFASIHYTAVQIDVLALQALFHHTEGNEGAALASLAAALELAQPGGSLRPFVDLGDPLQRLLAVLVRKQPATAYATRVLAAFPKTLATSNDRQQANAALLSPLTARELEVLALLEMHDTDKEIAETLVISLPTVRSHIEHLGEKLGASGRRNIVEVAKTGGLL